MMRLDAHDFAMLFMDLIDSEVATATTTLPQKP